MLKITTCKTRKICTKLIEQNFTLVKVSERIFEEYVFWHLHDPFSQRAYGLFVTRIILKYLASCTNAGLKLYFFKVPQEK